MTLTIENRRIVSRTYQKEMNLHLYIPPMSEHPPGCIRGTIFGLIQRYQKQNTLQQDFTYFAGLLYHRTLERGWDRDFIRGLILEATARAEKKITVKPPSEEEDQKATLFIHFQFHKDGISRQQIRTEFKTHLESICHNGLGTKKLTVAYSRPLNIGDHVTRARLHQANGKYASTILGEFKEGLDPY